MAAKSHIGYRIFYIKSYMEISYRDHVLVMSSAITQFLGSTGVGYAWHLVEDARNTVQVDLDLGIVS